MRNIIKIGLALIIAFLIQTSFLKIRLPLLLLIDVFSLIVIYFALKGGEIHGMFTGTAAGLIQDSFTFTIFGINGFSKTILGFFAGVIGSMIEIRQMIVLFPLIFIGILFETIVNFFLCYLVGVKAQQLNAQILIFQPFLTAIVGSIIFKIIFKFEK